MYLSGGKTTANASSLLPGSNVIWLAHVGSPENKGWNLAELVEIKSYYAITRETLAHKIIYDHLTRIETVDKIINVTASNFKGTMGCQQLMLTLATIEMQMQMQRKCIKGVLALTCQSLPCIVNVHD